MLLSLGSAKAAVAARFEEEAVPSSWLLEKAMREDM